MRNCPLIPRWARSASSATPCSPTPCSTTGSRRVGRMAVADRRPGGLGRLLLGLFLGVPFPCPVAAPAHPDRSTEELLVIRPALLDVVLRHAEEAGGREFLQ